MAVGLGTVSVPVGTAEFSFFVSREVAGGAATGTLSYTRPDGFSIASTEITTFSVAGNTATIGGKCRWNTGELCTFTVIVRNNGTPGASLDEFFISIAPRPFVGGRLKSGEIIVRS